MRRNMRGGQVERMEREKSYERSNEYEEERKRQNKIKLKKRRNENWQAGSKNEECITHKLKVEMKKESGKMNRRVKGKREEETMKE